MRKLGIDPDAIDHELPRRTVSVDRVFLDANVLFSAAYGPVNGLLKLWELPNVELFTFGYAIEEVRRNLEDSERLALLSRLIQSTTVVPESTTGDLPQGIVLPAKDSPILLAAIHAHAQTFDDVFLVRTPRTFSTTQVSYIALLKRRCRKRMLVHPR